jgi:hypothetical protein
VPNWAQVKTAIRQSAIYFNPEVPGWRLGQPTKLLITRLKFTRVGSNVAMMQLMRWSVLENRPKHSYCVMGDN